MKTLEMKMTDRIWSRVTEYSLTEVQDINAIALTMESISKLCGELEELDVYDTIGDSISDKIRLLENHFGLKIYINHKHEEEFELLIKV